MKLKNSIELTEGKIIKAFILLVDKIGYKKMKLVDIAKEADINRNTIYLHFESKESIFERIFMIEFKKRIPDFKPDKYIKYRNNRRKIENFYGTLFNIFDEKPTFYRSLLLDDSFNKFIFHEIIRIKKGIMPALKKTQKNNSLIDMILFGIFSILLNYQSYKKEVKNDNIKLLTDFTMINLRRIIYLP